MGKKKLCLKCKTDKNVSMWSKTVYAYFCNSCGEVLNDRALGEEFYPLCVKEKEICRKENCREEKI